MRISGYASHMENTQGNLKAAFAGESQANRRYLAFAKAAESEGKPNLAKLFRAVAEGETVHALNHLSLIGEVNSSAAENLKAAIDGETYEVEKMYPQFIKKAEEEGEIGAVSSFGRANQVEKIHQVRFAEALAEVESGNDIMHTEYFVCDVCGNLFAEKIPDYCPICKAQKEKFTQVE
jgi:rubrerythrin